MTTIRRVSLMLLLSLAGAAACGPEELEFRSDVPAVAPPADEARAIEIVSDVLEAGGFVRPELDSLKWTGARFELGDEMVSGLAWGCELIVVRGDSMAGSTLAHELAHCAHWMTYPDRRLDNFNHADDLLWLELVPEAERQLRAAGL